MTYDIGGVGAVAVKILFELECLQNCIHGEVFERSNHQQQEDHPSREGNDDQHGHERQNDEPRQSKHHFGRLLNQSDCDVDLLRDDNGYNDQYKYHNRHHHCKDFPRIL